MEVLDSRELCARIGALIARSAPRVEYYAADIKRFKRSFSRQDVAVFRQAGYPVGDMELFYVIQRFCDDIGLTDMVRVAEEAAKAERMPFHFFIPVAAVYLALTAGSELFIKWLDKRANVGVVRGN